MGAMDTFASRHCPRKVPEFQWEVDRRGQLGAMYSELLSEYCTVPSIQPGNTHVYAQYTIRCAHRDKLSADLKAVGIPTAVYYPKCLHEQPVFQDLGYSWRLSSRRKCIKGSS